MRRGAKKKKKKKNLFDFGEEGTREIIEPVVASIFSFCSSFSIFTRCSRLVIDSDFCGRKGGEERRKGGKGKKTELHELVEYKTPLVKTFSLTQQANNNQIVPTAATTNR